MNGTPDVTTAAPRVRTCLGAVLLLCVTLALSPSPVVAQSSSSTPTPTASPCVGDCDRSGLVAISEVVACVEIFATFSPKSVCPSCDRNDDGVVTIDEVQASV